MSYKEHVYEQLNKQLSFYIKALRYSLLPLTIIIAAIGIYWGIDINKTRNEIKDYRNELNTLIKTAQLASKEYDLSTREVDLLEVLFQRKVDSMKQGLDDLISEYEDLKMKNETALEKSNDLYKSLLGNNEDLDGITIEVGLMVNNAKSDIVQIKKNYSSEIDLAKEGVDERIKIAKEIQEEMQQQYNSLVKTSKLLLEALVLEGKIPIVTLGNTHIYSIRKEQYNRFNEVANELGIVLEVPDL